MDRKVSNLWIIDDDPMSSFYIKRLAELGELANIITIYDKAQGAVEYLLYHKDSPEHLPDIILLDIYMPGMDGWAFLEEYREAKGHLIKDIEIYIITSSNHPKDLQRAATFSEVKEFFQKPVTMEMLSKIMAVTSH